MESKKDSLVKVISYPGELVPTTYINCVKARWVRSYKRDNDFMKLVDPPSYYASYNKYVNAILKRPMTRVYFAVLEDDEDVVFGFSVLEGLVLHYVHVPRAYRKQGIASLLVPENIEWFTHITRTGLKLWDKLPKAKFDPFR